MLKTEKAKRLFLSAALRCGPVKLFMKCVTWQADVGFII